MAPPLVTTPPEMLERGSFSEQTYSGSCHCAAVAFTLIAPSIDELEVTTCNCSYCARRGGAHIYFRDTTMLVWTKGSWDDLTTYSFNTGHVAHLFCPTCGISVGMRVPDRSGHGEVAAINLRCIDAPRLDIDELKRRHCDGLNAIPRVDKPSSLSVA
ncbi:Mss4-like protein [Auriculariales sp. MPI-PUGE-AT-0066]|nr:Mss4-like protein [Auriculariales sp. MPI-PUGE-AT-0066]